MNKKIIYAVVALIIFAVGGFVWSSQSWTKKPVNKETVTVLIREPAVKITINDGKSILEDNVEASDALSALEKTADKKGIKIQMKKYDFGTIVTSLGDSENNKSKAWFYKVNGETAEVGADKYILKQDDQVEWYYDEIKF